MRKFNAEACKVVDMLEDLARMIIDDENVKEYFIETYDYLDGDDAAPVALRYIEDYFFS